MLPQILPELLAFVTGNLLTLAASHVMVGNKLSFIQGQLSQLLGVEATVKAHGEAIASLREAFGQARNEVHSLRLDVERISGKLEGLSPLPLDA